jgi:murein tripeptide amidase MpaA
MATYLMNELLEGKGRHFLDQLNFHILPSANPDGYEYTRYSDRMWRKTRSRNIEDPDDPCMGVDANRNWDFTFYGRSQ